MSKFFVRPDVQSFLDAASAQGSLSSLRDMSMAEIRDVMRGFLIACDLPIGPLGAMYDLSAPGPGGPIPLRLFDPRSAREPGPLLIYFHGGSFVSGGLDSCAAFCAEIARALDLPVVAVDYRLAPEHKWPAAPDDAEAATRWLATSPPELQRRVTGLVLAGDSAGGNLTIVTALALRARAAAAPLLMQWPLYPMVDDARLFTSHDEMDGYLFNADGIAYFDSLFAPDYRDWRAAPIKAPQAGLPPTFVVTAHLDPLRDQGRAYAAAACSAGVDTVFYEARGITHGFINMRKAVPSGIDDVTHCMAVMRFMLAAARARHGV